MMSPRRLCLPLLLLFAASGARAELPAPRLDRLVPLGANAGGQVEVEIGGPDLEDVAELRIDHPGVRAEPIADQQRRFLVTVAADTPAGVYDVWAVGRFGVSSPRLFAVSHGLADVAESEPNNTPEEAQPVALDVAINGQSDANNDDWFRFTARAGQRITVRCLAGKLESQLDAVLTLTGPGGAPLAANGDYHGRDPLVDFVAPADGAYRVGVHDLSYRGGHPYRLVISTGPQIENAHPRAIELGGSTDVTFFGRNLGPQAKPSAWRIEEQPLDELVQSIAAPDDLAPLRAYRFLEHPTDHTVLPTAATCTLFGFQAAATIGGRPADPVTFVASPWPVVAEVEPNDTADAAQPLALPAMVSGRFDQPRDADWYEFACDEAGPHRFEVYCERIAGRADPYLVLVDENGNRQQELDDFGHRVNAFDGHLRDPSGQVNLQAGKRYRVLVQDRYQRGGARYQYVLSIARAEPDFFAAAIHGQNPGPGGTTVRAGGATHIDIVLHHNNYSGPVTITADDLPPGVRVAPTTIVNNNRGVVVLWADDDAPPGLGFPRLTAEGVRDGVAFRREVRPYARSWSDGGMNSSRPLRRWPVAVRELAPFGLSIEPAEVEVAAGETAEVELKLVRHWADFTGDVNTQPLGFPGQFRLAADKFSPSETSRAARIEVQANTPPGRYTLAVLGQGQAPFHKDPAATERPHTLVSQPSRPVTIVVRP